MDDENHHLLQQLSLLEPPESGLRSVSRLGGVESRLGGLELSGSSRANDNNSPYNLAYSTNSESCQVNTACGSSAVVL